MIVVATSDAGTRRDVRRTAEPLGFAVHEVQDGVEAVEAAARLRPAALVLERILPRLRADEVAERLAAQAATRGRADPAAGRRGRRRGALPRVPAAPARP